MKKGLASIEREFSHGEINLFDLISQTCIMDMSYENEQDIIKLLSLFKNKTLDLNPKHMEVVAPTLEETLVHCEGVLKDKQWDCPRGFGRILTNEGVCYTFNMLNKTELLRHG